MKKIKYSEIVTSSKMEGAVINDEFIGFPEDYSVIHCLLKEWNPRSIFEIGTNVGNGCRVMRNSCPSAKIVSLDIRPEAGKFCPSDIEKVVGDSLVYDYQKHYPIDCWFIDGEHVYHNAFIETKKALESGAKYIIYHDADIPEVYDAILDSFRESGEIENYDIHQVIEPPFVYSSSGKNITRIAYAIKK
jgi:predicted O-methyltransferase YrrM